MIGVQLEPVDSWFFRDGTPFTAGSAPQDNVNSLFPPYPPTIVGVLRAMMALDNGWNGRDRWPARLNAVLGDGPQDLGKLSFDGPFLIQDKKPLFHAPHHLLGSAESQGWTPGTLLRPGTRVSCDLGKEVQLPEMTKNDELDKLKLKPGNNEWITQEGLNHVLRGQLPKQSDVVPGKCLWSVEVRTGLKRDESSRTAEEGMLYSTRHVRPHAGVALGARIAGLPPDWWRPPPSRLVPLGGESRLAECKPWAAKETLKLRMPLDEIAKSGKLALIALSPLDLEEDVVFGKRPLKICGIPELRAVQWDVVSACLQRPQRIGGWNSLRHCPLPLRSILPPGSVLFCKLCRHSEPLSARIVSGCNMVHVGSRQQWGFGLVAMGIWPNDCEVQP